SHSLIFNAISGFWGFVVTLHFTFKLPQAKRDLNTPSHTFPFMHPADLNHPHLLCFIYSTLLSSGLLVAMYGCICARYARSHHITHRLAVRCPRSRSPTDRCPVGMAAACRRCSPHYSRSPLRLCRASPSLSNPFVDK
uniref:Uncharacterized protein n=1 Tax=Lates calcarifer TaxID=8187 RepID=A0A4W6C1V6_LATCA